ncbi:MAG TPA: ATP-binding protein [Natronosporangium sp.]|nr:ATP-binding protein [Natronosporangium sp.]
MAVVRLAFTPAPRYVRTARLVGVAVAQRAGVAEELLDEVRLAIGEACARAVARHQREGIDEPVRVEMTDDGPYVVRVIDLAGPDDPSGPGGPGATSSGAGDPAGGDGDMAETVLAGLVDDLQVAPGEVRMTWPVRRRLGWR